MIYSHKGRDIKFWQFRDLLKRTISVIKSYMTSNLPNVDIKTRNNLLIKILSKIRKVFSFDNCHISEFV